MRTIVALLASLAAASAFAVTVQFQCTSPVASGQPTDCGVQIAPAQSGAVWVYDGARFVSIAPIPANGIQNWPVRNLAVGTHTLTAKVFYTVPAVCTPGQRCSMATVTADSVTVVVQ